ncbi:MAG TPA: hypothetical protein VHG28_14555 [Longimicrobiaceae bacterium]|nr:hypothetical protein [Longimicrobiaceae bacterium]
MGTRVVVIGDQRYTLSTDEPPAPGRAAWAAVQARGVDELTGEAPRVPVRISTPVAGLSPRAAAGGLVALSGIPSEVFPKLNVQGYTVPFSVSADGYLPVPGTAAVPLDAQFPDRFVPVRLPDVALHREPVWISGQVTEGTNGGSVPVAGATVEVTEIWPVLPPADGSVPPEAPSLVSLHPPLYTARPAAAGRLRRRNVTEVAGQDKSTLADADPGATGLDVSDRVGLAVGSHLLIDTDPAIQELATVTALDPADGSSLPAQLVFAHPLAFRHRRGSRVRRVTLQPPGAQKPFARPALAGDTCVYLNNLTGLAAAQVVEVSGGGPAAEFHRLGRFTVLTDAQGRYRFPPLARAAQLTVRATGGGDTREVTFVPDYTRRENRLDIGF